MLHIVEDISNFGPPCAYHLFSCERWNGMLEHIPNDHRAPCVTMMRAICHAVRLAHLASCVPEGMFETNEIKALDNLTKRNESIDIAPPMKSNELLFWFRAASGLISCNGSEGLDHVDLRSCVRRKHATFGMKKSDHKIPADLRHLLNEKLKVEIGSCVVIR
jgi:hypothetical protein